MNFNIKIIRPLFITATAILIYLLFIQWQGDYGKVAPTKPSVMNPDTNNIPAFDSSPSNEQTNDIPVIGSSKVIKDKIPPNNENIIIVETDVLRISIDTLGGDIVKAELLQYRKTLNSNEPFVLAQQTPTTYIAQSGLIGVNGTDVATVSRPLYKAESKLYKLSPSMQELVVPLIFYQDKVKIIKEFIFKPNSYLINLRFNIENKAATNWRGNLFGQIKYYNNSSSSFISSATGAVSYTGAAISSPDKSYAKVTFSDIDENPLEQNIVGGWLALIQHYFVSAWIPGKGDQNIYQFNQKNNNYFLRFITPSISIPTGETKIISASLYTGPKIKTRLEDAAENLNLTVDYGWLWFISQPLFIVLKWLYDVFGNWGAAIIILTLLIKLIFFKLSATSYRSMARMRKLTPEFERIKRMHAGDKAKISQSIMALYKKEKVNPVSGCLPMLVQMPVFLALYWVLLESVELRHAPFMLWIHDLSDKDPYFILPIIMGVSMFIQQRLSPAPADPTQAKVMKMLPIIFTFFFLWFPAGLVLYWTVNNCLSILQQYVITKKIDKG